MAITAGNVSSTNSAISWSHNNDGDFLVVGYAAHNDGPGGPATYNGVSMTEEADMSVGAANPRCKVWSLVSPASGVNTIAGITSGNEAKSSGVAVSYSGVDPTTPTRTPTVVDAAAAATSFSDSVTTVADDWVVEFTSITHDPNANPIGHGAGETERVEDGGTDFAHGWSAIADKVAVGTSTTTSSDWVNSTGHDHCLLPIIPAAAAGGGTPIHYYRRRHMVA